MYIRKRWLYLSLAILISIAGGYVYIHFFQTEEADEVCCVKHELTPPNVLTITESSPIANLDSSKANQQITYNILNQVQEGLMRLGSNNIPILGLAESYQVSPDYRTYSFTIRKNAVWSDGKAVTADDFKFAWERALSPANAYEYSFLFYPIHNAEAYSNGEIGFDQVGITVTDKNHLSIKLDKPDPQFLSLLTLTSFLPQRSDIVEKYGADFASTPEMMSFTGPFQIKTVTPKKAILIKNTSYWDRAHVRLSGVVINIDVNPLKQVNLFKSESTGMTQLNATYMKQIDKKAIKIINKGVTDFLEMNESSSLLSNLNVRKAIQLGLNKSELIHKLPGYSNAMKLIPPISKKTQVFSIQVPYNLKEAQTLLNKGLDELKANQNYSISLVTYNDLPSINMANEVKRQLELIGLKVDVKKYDIVEKSKVEESGHFDLSISEWSLKYQNPMDFLSLWNSKDGLNISGFADPHYDSLLDQASLEANPTKRDQLLQQAERYLIEEKAAIVPLVYVNDLRLQKSYVKNVLYHPFGADYSLKWATYQPPKKVEATK